MRKIIIIDAICGAGKTSWAIQHMVSKSAMGKERFIYVTPFLSEIQRIIEDTNGDFKQPTTKNCKGKKTEGLRQLVVRGENIVCSHELFKKCNNELLDLIAYSDYTLILDEVLNVINEISISENDINMLIESNIIETKEDGSVQWKDPLYTGKFEEIKYLAKTDNLFLYNGKVMFWTLNHKAFTAFKEVYVLTYLFDGQIQRYYYDLYNLSYEKKSVVLENGKYKLIKYNPRLDFREEIAKRLRIYEDSGKSKFNSNFCKKPTNYMFSSTWLKNCDKVF